MDCNTINCITIETPGQLNDLVKVFADSGVKTIAMDFEEESNLHVYGEHLCLVQVFDGTSYYMIDAWKIQNYPDGTEALKLFLESPVEKIMFDCTSDAAIVRKSLKIQLKNVFDIRVIAQTLGFMGNLTSLIERNLHIQSENPLLKKKYQRANWMKRPLSEEQIMYALDDVKYLFDLKLSLQEELKAQPMPIQKKVQVAMRKCAEPKHQNKPGWEKICNYKKLSRSEKIYLRNFFVARDNLAKKANCPPTNVVEKQILVSMAEKGTWEGLLDGPKLRYSGAFEQARLKAVEEIKTHNQFIAQH